MRKKARNKYKNIFVGFILSLLVFTFNFAIVENVKANDSSVYFWSIEKSIKSYVYQENVHAARNEKIEEVLEVDDINPYFENMKSMYELAVSKDKVKEVEKIISDCEKQVISYELYLLTGNENLSNEYLANEDLYFSFEMVI